MYLVVLAAFVATAGTVMVKALTAGDGRAPDVGLLEAVYASDAQKVEPLELSPGATFGQILTDAGLDANEQSALLLAFREQASPRRMRAGTEVRLVWQGDREWLSGIEVDINRDETVHLDRSEVGWLSSKEVVVTVTDTVFVAGRIGSILWNSVMDHGDLSEMPASDRARLIHRLDQVFQWQVDFSRQIREGDYYRFAFERHVRPDGSMRDGSLISAELVNEGRSYHAIWFDPNGDGDGTYYDLEGQSVRRAFLKKPLEFRRIASRYTNSRFHPILKRWRAHRGIDYSADTGTPIQATGDGVVVRRNWSDTYGNVIDIRHPNGFITRYAHMSGWGPGIVQGSRVKQGEVIGYVGMTGLAVGPHLHYEMRTSAGPIDPLAIELPAGDPVPTDDWDRWREESADRLAMLLKLPDPETFRAANLETPTARSDN
ncbi:MAG: peptidoglycan DD-metalloendopeptidase family protein [Gemmatimonadetes bacterium]|nr:peptidoglycan DD-metalloendopeptidase family protein [Gemmatimonadota bacterium]